MQIDTIDDLIEHLETVRVALHPSRLTPERYEMLGWVNRPLMHLIDRCREEQERQSWQTARERNFEQLAEASLTISTSSVGLVNAGHVGNVARALGKGEP